MGIYLFVAFFFFFYSTFSVVANAATSLLDFFSVVASVASLELSEVFATALLILA